MPYFGHMDGTYNSFKNWLALLHERGGDTAAYEAKVVRLCEGMQKQLVKAAEAAPVMKDEPSGLDAIRGLRPRGPRRLVESMAPDVLRDKLMGAWLGRAAGCILGIPPEGMSKRDIKNAAQGMGMKYPLADYWPLDPKLRGKDALHYGLTPRRKFLKGKVTYAGTDDDLTYTLLGLLIFEDHGIDFTTADVGAAWLKYLPTACTAEKVALDNLRAGMSAAKCGEEANPFVDWIGADIRSDPWGYAAPGCPEKAAEFAHRDAYISHRATGIHGEMFFSAAIAAAFAVDAPVEAIKIGLTEIPRKCRTALCVKEALKWCKKDGDWDKTTERILSKYAGMSMAHTLNNAALTVAGLYYGEKDFGKTIALTVMGGVDTDCTGATAGSLLGAILGAKALRKTARRWIAPLGTRAQSYIIGHQWWRHESIVKRFAKVAEQVLASA